MNWEGFLQQMQSWGELVMDPKSFIQLPYETQVTPREYIQHADKDLLLQTNHGYVNALSNAKRAIDCQITNLLVVLGVSRSGDIHKKIERIESISVLAPQILTNLLESNVRLDRVTTRRVMEERLHMTLLSK